MTGLISRTLKSRKLMVTAAVAATALAFSAPASAGGYYGHLGYSGHYGGGHYYNAGYRHGYRHRGHRRHYSRGHRGGGGKGAAIALGVIGGAIILNEIAENNADRRAYDRRYYDRYDRYDRYSTRAAPTYDREAFERGYEQGYVRGRDAEAQAYPDQDFGDQDFGDQAPQDLRQGDVDERSLDQRLDGARFDGGPQPIRFSAAEAYQTCMTHARSALSERGYMMAAPAAPDTAEDVGGAWKMTATVSAQSREGESWSRAMYCEADASRVYLLELI